MIDRNNTKDSSQEKTNQTEENGEQLNQVQKMNVNPDPRANENVKNIPFEKEQGVGSEITDGEAG
jgi:mannitol-specific phosphotransferase system IIBC component